MNVRFLSSGYRLEDIHFVPILVHDCRTARPVYCDRVLRAVHAQIARTVRID